jgi:hypothetical protein
VKPVMASRLSRSRATGAYQFDGPGLTRSDPSPSAGRGQGFARPGHVFRKWPPPHDKISPRRARPGTLHFSRSAPGASTIQSSQRMAIVVCSLNRSIARLEAPAFEGWHILRLSKI